MGLEMYLSQSQEQASSMKVMCQSYKDACQELQTAVDGFLNSSNELKGEAFDSARAHYSNVLLPLVRGAEMMVEIAESEVSQFPEEFVAQVIGTDLKEDELLARIQEQNEAIAALDKIQTDLASSEVPTEEKTEQTQANDGLLKDHYANKQALEELLQKFREFNAYSTSIFSKLAEIEGLMDTGFGQADAAWDPQAGMFVTPSNLSWANTLNAKYTASSSGLTPEEQEFLQDLKEQYGYDDETARLILDVKRRIDKKFPKMKQKQKDYLFNRILGGLVESYTGGRWDGTAGDISPFFLGAGVAGYSSTSVTSEDALKLLGMDEKDIEKLRYNVRLQHSMASGELGNYDSLSDTDKSDYKSKAESIYGSMTDEQFKEFWNQKQQSYYGKNDYAHQSITTATILYDNPFRAANFYSGSKGDTDELAGWRGDTTKDAGNSVSIGNDDYKADLDAVNITDIMEEKGMSYVEASNYYYNHMEEKADPTTTNYTRSEQFKNHASVDHVKDKIFNSLVPKTPVRLGYNVDTKSEEEKMAYLKEHYPQSYNFIRSLEENDNNIEDYANKE